MFLVYGPIVDLWEVKNADKILNLRGLWSVSAVYKNCIN